MKSRIVRLRETFLTQKHCAADKDFMHHSTISSIFSGSLLKILQNCTFRINSHELNGGRRRSGRVVECTGLENRRTLTRTVGSNPTSSARLHLKIRDLGKALKMRAFFLFMLHAPHDDLSFEKTRDLFTFWAAFNISSVSDYRSLTSIGTDRHALGFFQN